MNTNQADLMVAQLKQLNGTAGAILKLAKSINSMLEQKTNTTPEVPRRYQSKGNGLKGPKTTMMARQLELFKSFLAAHPVTGEASRITRAHQCWMAHPRWNDLATANDDYRGYSSYKALASAK